VPESKRNRKYRQTIKGKATRAAIQKRYWERRHPVLKKLDRIRTSWGNHVVDWFLELIQDQKFKCYACARKLSFGFSDESVSRACIDHDHKYTQKEIRNSGGTDSPIYPRMLLCNSCNRALGSLKDDPKVLRKLADAIEKYKEK
jgi:hypothetical protein